MGRKLEQPTITDFTDAQHQHIDAESGGLIAGRAGASGASGASGMVGVTGISGSSGMSGASGMSGHDAQAGYSGESGASGIVNRIGQGTLGANDAGGWGGYTAMIRLNESGVDASSPIAGIVSHVQIQVSGAGSVKVKFLRVSGSNILYLGGSGPFTVAAGLNEVDITPVSVQVGDFIAIYYVNSIARYAGSVSGGCWYYNGEVTGDTVEGSWAAGNAEISIGGTIVPPSVSVNQNRVWIIG